jgi:hypothetical protein
MSDANRVGLQGEALASYEAALEDYKRYLAEWTEHVETATTYRDVCMKTERDGERLGKPWVISALGELSLVEKKAILALEYRCACACVSCGRLGARASRTGRCAATDVQAGKLGQEQQQQREHHHDASRQAVFRA